jgi:hypothetical protein
VSGADFLWFLESLWLDLTNLDTADLPSLVFRIIVLVGVLFFGTFLLRVTVTVIGGLTRSYIVPPVVLVWDVLTYPLRLPFRIVRRVRSTRHVHPPHPALPPGECQRDVRGAGRTGFSAAYRCRPPAR